ncbi:MAG: protein phosphatase CheZ [Deltaproteobacteria bacterium]|jgi:chemotaxis protein CheZ|nr:protein phosphatase CheZ [Deltaproteobacteria bacterium]
MPRKKSLSRQIIDILKQPGFAEVRPDLLQTIHTALRDYAATESKELYIQKRINENMLDGLNNIYKEIAKISGSGAERKAAGATDGQLGAAELFKEASRQLDEIMVTTYNAADDIMNKAEFIQGNQAAALRHVASLRASPARPGVVDALEEAVKQNMEAINAIITALSFQDLTGQRIKKVVNALSAVHQMVVETYVSAGLMLKKTEEEPEKDFETIALESHTQAEATIKNSELKGPVLNSSQAEVDDLLARLGL